MILPTRVYNIISILLFAFLMCSISCTPTKKVEEDNGFDKEKIIVLLKNSASAQQLESEFKDYQLKSTGQVSRSENRHRFEYNNNLIKANTLLEKIKASDLVIEANFATVVTSPKVGN